MTPIFGQDIAVASWVSERIGRLIEPPFTAIGFADHAGPVAGAVFNDYQPGGNIELTFAADGRVSRRMLKTIAIYVFRTLGCSRVTVRTREDNERARDLALRLGFVREVTLKDYFGTGVNAVMFRMLRKDCKRWLH